MTADIAAPAPQLGHGLGFAILMLVLTGAFIWLGVWQVERLAEKEALIAAVAARLDAPPVPLPPASDWPGLDVDALNFQPGDRSPAPSTTTRPLPSSPALSTDAARPPAPAIGSSRPSRWRRRHRLRQSRLRARGAAGRNSWPMDPTGRGDHYRAGRVPAEAVGASRPAPIPPSASNGCAIPIGWRRWSIRHWRRSRRFYIDLPANPAGGLPQGGETVVEFPNNHLGYALTWFGFALITPIMLGFWLWRQRRAAKPRRGKRVQ